jgi:hypothetical protein
MARRYAIGLGVIWLLIVIISVVNPIMTPAEGDGFTRGLNRIMLFFMFQFVAIFIAIAGLYAALKVERPRAMLVRIAGFGPAIVSGLLIVILIGVITWTNLSKPSPESPPPASAQSVTEPVDPGN